MKQAIYILAFFLLTDAIVFGQTTNKCDTIYDFVETMPQYDKGDSGVMKYIMKELSPLIGDCMKRDNSVIASLQIILTIDKTGNVIDATFPKPNATEQCKADMKRKLMTMTGWIPGLKNGQPVCCHLSIPIGCLKWQ